MNNRQQKILNTLLIGSFLSLLFYNLSNLYYIIISSRNLYAADFILTLLMILILVIWYKNRDYYKETYSLLYITIFTIAIIYSFFYWGSDLPINLLASAMVIIFAGILLRRRVALIFTLIFVATIIFFSFSEQKNIINPNKAWRKANLTLGDGIDFSIILFIISIVSWLSNREIEYSLNKALASEKALREERNLLEKRVEERTKEIQEIELARTIDLHKMAESGKMASDYFHDLMNSLTAVAISIETIQVDESSHVIKKQIDTAIKSSQNMANLIKAIKRYDEQQENQIFNLQKEVSQIINIHDYQVKKNNALIHNYIDEKVQIKSKLDTFYHVIHIMITHAVNNSNKVSNNQRKIITINCNSNEAKQIINLQYETSNPETKLRYHINKSDNIIPKDIKLDLIIAKKLVQEVLLGNLIMTWDDNKATFLLELPST